MCILTQSRASLMMSQMRKIMKRLPLALIGSDPQSLSPELLGRNWYWCFANHPPENCFLRNLSYLDSVIVYQLSWWFERDWFWPTLKNSLFTLFNFSCSPMWKLMTSKLKKIINKTEKLLNILVWRTGGHRKTGLYHKLSIPPPPLTINFSVLLQSFLSHLSEGRPWRDFLEVDKIHYPLKYNVLSRSTQELNSNT